MKHRLMIALTLLLGGLGSAVTESSAQGTAASPALAVSVALTKADGQPCEGICTYNLNDPNDPILATISFQNILRVPVFTQQDFRDRAFHLDLRFTGPRNNLIGPNRAGITSGSAPPPPSACNVYAEPVERLEETFSFFTDLFDAKQYYALNTEAGDYTVQAVVHYVEYPDKTCTEGGIDYAKIGTGTFYGDLISVTVPFRITSADNIAPTTTSTVTPPANANGWHKTDVTVKLDATDNSNGSGVKDLTYRLDGALTTNGPVVITGHTTTLTISPEGITTLSYFARDNALNQEALKQETYRIDRTAPTLQVPPPIEVLATSPNGATVNYQVSATDNLDPAPTVTCSPPSGSVFPIGVTTVSCTASDAAGNTTQKSFTVTVQNRPPVAGDDAYDVAENTALTVAAPGVLANDTDPDAHPLTAVLVTGPTKGALTLNANGSFTYTPNLNVTGTDSFTYRANDGVADSALATVTLTLIPLIQRASVASDGTQGNSFSGNAQAAVSADGRYVAFVSLASNLVPNDTNKAADVFVFDRQNKTTTRISMGHDGREANGHSLALAISANGQYVAFVSFATNLLPPGQDTNGTVDVFVYDRVGNKTTRVSVGSSGQQADRASITAAISADGQFVAFSSAATNLDEILKDTNSKSDIYVRDWLATSPKTIRVSKRGTTQANGDSLLPAISDNGQVVAFLSTASNLLASGDLNGKSDIFVWDQSAGTPVITRVSVTSTGVEANGASASVSLSGNGQYVAFSSIATNLDLVVTDTNLKSDVFVHDRSNGKTSRISIRGSTQGNGDSLLPAISADGRFVAFASRASNLLATSDTNLKSDVFVYDRTEGTTIRRSVAKDGAQGTGDSTLPAINRDGRFISFSSNAPNLVTDDKNGVFDVFLTFRP